jgi:hypothetical protein
MTTTRAVPHPFLKRGFLLAAIAITMLASGCHSTPTGNADSTNSVTAAPSGPQTGDSANSINTNGPVNSGLGTGPQAVPGSDGPLPSGDSPSGEQSQFCLRADQLGVDEATIADASNPAAEGLVRALDALDALAPPAIKADFDRYTRLEHSVVSAGDGPGPLATGLDASTTAALAHVTDYLQRTCGLT